MFCEYKIGKIEWVYLWFFWWWGFLGFCVFVLVLFCWGICGCWVFFVFCFVIWFRVLCVRFLEIFVGGVRVFMVMDILMGIGKRIGDILDEFGMLLYLNIGMSGMVIRLLWIRFMFCCFGRFVWGRGIWKMRSIWFICWNFGIINCEL